MGKQCAAIKQNGKPCEAWAAGGEYCFTHDPARVADRAAARKKGGLNRRAGHGGSLAAIPGHVRAIGDVLTLLDYTLAETLTLENSIARARSMIALAGAYMQAIETGDFETRLQALEAAANVNKN